ncbi:MAG TPA: hypothetical protein VF223_15200 [Trebonia sp.]
MTRKAAVAVAPALDAVRGALAAAPVAHSGETGSGSRAGSPGSTRRRPGGKYVLVIVHPRRGRDEMDVVGVLPAFGGTACHDARRTALQKKRHAPASRLAAREADYRVNTLQHSAGQPDQNRDLPVAAPAAAACRGPVPGSGRSRPPPGPTGPRWRAPDPSGSTLRRPATGKGG